MVEHQYRWSINFALLKVVFSAIGWTAIVGLPGLFVWMWTLDKQPEREGAVVAGIAGVILLCSLLHSRKYWRRFFDRTPQLELYGGFLRARQLGDEDIPWTQVRNIRGTEEVVSRDISYLILDTDDGEMELDLAGLDAPMRDIFEATQGVWQRRLQSKPI